MIIKNVKGTNKPLYEFVIDESMHVHVSDGNKKIGKGIASVAFMPGDELRLIGANNQLLSNVCGTCNGCCDMCKHDCYAINDTKYHHNTVVPAVGENTILMRYEPTKFFNELDDFFKHNLYSYCRWNESGEFDSKESMQAVLMWMTYHPEITFYFYTKRYEWLDDLHYIIDNATNIRVSVSPWNNDYINPSKYHEFIYDDGSNPELDKLIHCPAVDIKGNYTGVTCSMCRRCIKAEKGTKTAVYAHGRIKWHRG